MQVRQFEDFVKERQLWLIHIGHSWYVYWVSAVDDGSGISIEPLRKDWPRSAEVQEKRQIKSADELRRFADIVQVSKDTLAGLLNAEPADSGFKMILGMQGWGA